MYEVDRDYDSLSWSLPETPYVIQCGGSTMSSSPIIQWWKPPPQYLQWTRNPMVESPFLNGYFNDGATIQISASKGVSIDSQFRG
jgi:hypothetical protein